MADATARRESTPIVMERLGSERWIWLNRPARRNALDDRLISALDSAIIDAADDPTAEVVIIAGRGKSFCAGADLAYLLSIQEQDPGPSDFIASVSACLARLEQCLLPTIAAVHGHAVAGGLELALACDVVIAARGTLIGDGHIRNGLVPGGGSTVRLPRKVGPALARWLLLSGELLPAEELAHTGWLHTVVDESELLVEAASLAKRLSSVSTPIQSYLKKLLHQIEGQPPLSAFQAETQAFAEHWASTDVPAGLHAFFAARRSPDPRKADHDQI